MRYVSEKVLDEKIAEMRHMLTLGHGMFEVQLTCGIKCLETLKITCLEELPGEKLQPMSDAPRAEPFLVKLKPEDVLHEAWYLPSGLISVAGLTFKDTLAEGWRPIPKVIV